MAARSRKTSTRSTPELRHGGRSVHDGPRMRPAPGQYLTFRIASETYAVPVLETSEVLAHEESTPVPGAAGWIHGLLNVRGRAVPVIDLAAKFGSEDRAAGASTCIIVLEVVLDEEAAQVGLIADDMPAVVTLGADQISDPPLFGTLVHARYLRGMARLDGTLVLVLDAVGALSAEDVALLKQLEESPSTEPDERASGDSSAAAPGPGAQSEGDASGDPPDAGDEEPEE